MNFNNFSAICTLLARFYEACYGSGKTVVWFFFSAAE